MNELSIKVNIADRYYPLTVTPEQEAIVRQAARLINDKIKVLQQQFDIRDKQDMLSMTVLEFATELIALQKSSSGNQQELNSELAELQSLLKDIAV